MRRAACAEADPRPSRPWRHKPATSAAGDGSPGRRSPYRERESRRLRRLRRPRSIGCQSGAVGGASATTEAGETVLGPGMAAGFPKGKADGDGEAYAGATGAYWLRRLDCNQGLSRWPTVMAESGKVPDANRGRRARRPVKLLTRLPQTG